MGEGGAIYGGGGWGSLVSGVPMCEHRIVKHTLNSVIFFHLHFE